MRRPWIIVAAALMVSGCGGASDKRAGVTAVARAFYSAIQDGDGSAACAELAPETRHKLEESEGQACPEALMSLHLSARSVRGVDAYGRGARVELDTDTAFASRMREGWRITAAGCKERASLPYDCQLEK